MSGWIKGFRARGLARALEAHLHSVERMLPAVIAALPQDRRARARAGFAQLKNALDAAPTFDPRGRVA